MSMQDKFDKALLEALKYFKKKKNILGILVGGSYVNGNLSKNSDIDLFIVMEDVQWREKGIKLFNGVEVEYFLQPYSQILKYFERESESLRRTTISVFSSGKILFDPKNKVKKLVGVAKKLSSKKLPQVPKARVDLIKYFVEDDLKDLSDAVENKDVALANLIINSLFHDMLENYFLLERFPKPKSKYLLSGIKDKEFRGKVTTFLKSNSIEIRTNSINKLAEYFLKLYGGRLPKEHKFRLKTTY
jgi:predicted nucleotidyltransferase